MTTRSTWSVNEEETSQEEPLHWINVIFIPFHPTFRLLVLVCCTVAIFTGPIQAIIPLHGCWDVLTKADIILYIQQFSLYVCYPVFVIDCLLHVAHRQVQEEATRRQHKPKTGLTLFVDVIAILPLFTMFSNEICPTIRFWPNILCLNKFLLIYRFFDYFSLASSHSALMLCVGFILVLLVVLNSLAILTILVTTTCDSCHGDNMTSWMVCVEQAMPSDYSVGARKFTAYFYGARVSSQYFMNVKYDTVVTMRTVRELGWVAGITLVGFFLKQFIMSPKLFAEFVLRIRRRYLYDVRCRRVVVETQRRNTEPSVARVVENYYSVVWQQRDGLTSMPSVYASLPKVQRIDISMDISWPLFLHSPNLRRTSMSFKRWLSQRVVLTYRMPNERFFVGPHCYTNLYYLKTGVVQLLSNDDLMSPLLSMAGGTIIGDISYYLPPRHQDLVMRCLTYCEVLTVTQFSLIQALRHFPEDRRHICDLTRSRIEHALCLYSHKPVKTDAVRAEDESISWIKIRWWEIMLALRHWKKSKRERIMQFPEETTNHHCPKYLGQLVLSSEQQLSSKSMFLVDSFPWVVSPRSSFIENWRRMMKFFLYIMLLLDPPTLTRLEIPRWFYGWRFFCDKVFLIDVMIALITAREADMESANLSLITTVVSRLGTFYFLLDVLSTDLFDRWFLSQSFYFNRFLKLYQLFLHPQGTDWKLKNNYIEIVLWNIAVIFTIIEAYVYPFLFYQIVTDLPQYFTKQLWFGTLCSPAHDSREICKNQTENVFKIPMEFITEVAFDRPESTEVKNTRTDLIMAYAIMPKKVFQSVLLFLYLASAIYLKRKPDYQYQGFVSSTLELFSVYKLHPDLMLRMTKYLDSQWKSSRGVGVMFERVLRDEPYDIYMKVHGSVAQHIISESDGFDGASLPLVRDLALRARYITLPKGSTIFLFGVKCDKIVWLVKGVVRCEYHDDKGELLTQDYFDGAGIEHAAALLSRPALQTYTTATDCEMLYIESHEFSDILARHELEETHLNTVTDTVGPMYDALFYRHIKRHREYQKKLRHSMYHGRKSIAVGLHNVAASMKGESAKAVGGPDEGGILAALFLFLSSYRKEPESVFMKIWMPLRALTVMIAIICWSLKGGFDAIPRARLHSVIYYCNIFNILDVLIKFGLPYYDDRGLIQRQLTRTAWRYATRSLVIDVLPVLPWRFIFSSDYEDDGSLLIFKSLLTFLQIYVIGGYFDYLSDTCTGNVILLCVVKWTLIKICIFFESALFFVTQCSVIRNDIAFWSTESCWLLVKPELDGVAIPRANLSRTYLHSCNFAQVSIVKVVTGIPDEGIELYMGHFMVFCLLAGSNYLISCVLFSNMVLATRSNALFMHSLRQLDRFLTSERLERPLIDKTLEHFNYSWNRFRGVDFVLLGQRVGILFRQDLNFFFYKQSLQALDSVLQGGEPLMRELSGHVVALTYQPDHDIVREMDLSPYIYIVHRGRVIVSRHGSKLATLAKGCIFGQLDSPKIRPLRITARCDEHVDLLYLPLRTYHELLSREVHKRVMANPDSSRDFLTLRKTVPENPYNTLRYLLRGDTLFKLPYFMEDPVEAGKSKWLTRFLILTHAVGPLAASLLVPLIGVIPLKSDTKVHLNLMGLTDFIQLLHIIMLFFKMEIVVQRKRIVTKYMRVSILRSPRFYVDVVSLVVPIVGFPVHFTALHYARLLRLHLVLKLYNDLAKSVKANWVLIFIRMSASIIFLHQLTCTYVIIACRHKDFPAYGGEYDVLLKVNATIDRQYWYTWQEYKDMLGSGGKPFLGCPSSLCNLLPDITYTKVFSRSWHLDYVLSFNFMIGILTGFNNALASFFLIITHSEISKWLVGDFFRNIKPETILELSFKIVVTFILSLLLLWLSATVVSAMMTRFYELYEYDYHVGNLVNYLMLNQASPIIIKNVRDYTRMLWDRQRGTWLPAMVSTGPLCLREDLFCSLYMHHLVNCPCFRELPDYFQRQLVVNFERVIMLPGRFIVKQGDICPYTYFIHEGEVEKWVLENDADEEKLMSVLTTTGVFGIVSGLFPECPFSASYYTRTVVDLVFLRNDSWQDLLNSYPDVKKDLIARAEKFKEENYRFQRRAETPRGRNVHTHIES